MTEGDDSEGAIYLHDGEEGLIQIVRKGDDLFGSTVSRLVVLKKAVGSSRLVPGLKERFVSISRA